MTPPRPTSGSQAGALPAAYDRGRPGYPAEAVAWLVGTAPVSVLELGAGTGKLTEAMVELGHDVLAVDPDDAMLDRLSRKLPDVRATVGSAEQIPAPSRSVDVVVAGQAFHRFDLERAMPEIVRVLKPGGRLALVWNVRDDRIPWVRKLERLIGSGPDTALEAADLIDRTALFSAVDAHTFKQWQVVQRETIQDLVLSLGNVASLGDADRAAKLAEVLALYDDYGRGMDGMQLPYTTYCYRATVLPHAVAAPEPVDLVRSPPELHPADSLTDTAERLPTVVTGGAGETDLILINFR